MSGIKVGMIPTDYVMGTIYGYPTFVLIRKCFKVENKLNAFGISHDYFNNILPLLT